MKKILSLLISLGLASLPAIAQVHSMPQPTPGAESAGASASGSSASGNGVRAEAGGEQPLPSPIARLRPVTHDDVTYLCGGVGEEESNYMKQEAKGYDLMLTFAARSGAYLADVDVDIRDARGNQVLQMSCDAPILLVDLPHGGTYKVRAEAAGYTLNKTISVAGSRKHAPKVASSILSWPQQVVDESVAPTSTGSGEGGSRAAGSGAR